jgi:DGQHR domain-containing protein
MNVKFNATQVVQPIGEFFIAKLSAEMLVNISSSDVRELNKESELETYLGIQRPLNKARAKDIQNYVKNYDATFPSSIILCVDYENIKWSPDKSEIELIFEDGKSPAKIIDGQHRVAGFMDLDSYEPIKQLCNFEKNGKTYPFELIVTILVGLDLPEQANIFATVNLKQTKVSKSLAYDLEAYTKTRSPQKTGHEIVIALDKHEKSPFYERVKRLGVRSGIHESISQAMLVEEIINLISINALEDRDILLRIAKDSFSSFRSKKNLESLPLSSGKVLRQFFIDNDDELILQSILSFFLAVREKWPKAWAINNKDSVLNKTVGIRALFRLFKDVMTNYLDKDTEQELNVKFFSNVFYNANISDEFFENLDATSATVSKVYYELISECDF